MDKKYTLHTHPPSFRFPPSLASRWSAVRGNQLFLELSFYLSISGLSPSAAARSPFGLRIAAAARRRFERAAARPLVDGFPALPLRGPLGRPPVRPICSQPLIAMLAFCCSRRGLWLFVCLHWRSTLSRYFYIFCVFRLVRFIAYLYIFSRYLTIY